MLNTYNNKKCNIFVSWAVAVRVFEYKILSANISMLQSTIAYICISNASSIFQNRVFMIRTIFASTEWLLLYFSRKLIMIHGFIENLKSRVAWNHGDGLNSHCGLCILIAKLLSSNYTKKAFYCNLQLRLVSKKYMLSTFIHNTDVEYIFLWIYNNS